PALHAGVDSGLSNVTAIAADNAGFVPHIVNGRPVKSINQFSNKRRAALRSRLGMVSTSRRLERGTGKRTRRIDHYLHMASRHIIEPLAADGLGTLCIGKIPTWKQGANLGRHNNQHFVSIAHARLIAMLIYKAELVGIRVCVTEESYSSKANFLDADALPVCGIAEIAAATPAPAFRGKRAKRAFTGQQTVDKLMRMSTAPTTSCVR